MMEKRGQFTFYDSFFRAVSRIKNMADRAMAYDALCSFALTGEEPELDTLPETVAIVFEMCKPNLIASRRKADAGSQRRRRKQEEANEKQEETNEEQEETESKEEANCKQTEANCKQAEASDKQIEASDKQIEANRKQTEANRKQDKEQDKEQDKDKDKEKEQMLLPPTPSLHKGKVKRFGPPSVEEVAAYCLERKNRINPQAFVDFYASKGWMVGKTRMEDWQAAVRTWEARDRQSQGCSGGNGQAATPSSFAMEAVRRMMEEGGGTNV